MDGKMALDRVAFETEISEAIQILVAARREMAARIRELGVRERTRAIEGILIAARHANGGYPVQSQSSPVTHPLGRASERLVLAVKDLGRELAQLRFRARCVVDTDRVREIVHAIAPDATISVSNGRESVRSRDNLYGISCATKAVIRIPGMPATSWPGPIAVKVGQRELILTDGQTRSDADFTDIEGATLCVHARFRAYDQTWGEWAARQTGAPRDLCRQLSVSAVTHFGVPDEAVIRQALEAITQHNALFATP